MVIVRPGAIDGAPMGPKQSGGRRRGNFLVSRGMGDSPGEDKLPRRGCGIGGRGVSRPWARSTPRRGRMERSAGQSWSWRRWRPYVTGEGRWHDSAIFVALSWTRYSHQSGGRFSGKNAPICVFLRVAVVLAVQVQALRRGACSRLEQTRCDPTAPIDVDHGDEGKCGIRLWSRSWGCRKGDGDAPAMLCTAIRVGRDLMLRLDRATVLRR